MSEEFCEKCIFKIKLQGETHISLYQKEKILLIDIHTDDFRKSFFLDFHGNIVCPFQINKIMKKIKQLDSENYLFYRPVLLLIFKSNLINQKNLQKENYLNFSENDNSCYLRILFSENGTCVGVMEEMPDKNLQDCLKLLPKEIRNWERLNISSEKIQVFPKEKK